MAEYIDKDTLIEDAKTWFVTPDNSPLYDDIMRMVMNRVKLIPAADVRENVKAEWKQVEDHSWAGKGKTVCSKCHYGYSWRMYFEVDRFNYCPNCGAKMEVQDG